MPELDVMSPAVRRILQDNNFKATKLLRYGPRFVCAVVDSDRGRGMLKLVLPEIERDLPDYAWPRDERTDVLERRIIKEAKFLQYFASRLGTDNFEPRILDYSKTAPVWSLRTYFTERSMSAWESNFIFSPRFYQQIRPQQMVDFFHNLHELSEGLPNELGTMIRRYVSTLTHTSRFEDTLKASAARNRFSPRVSQLTAAFERNRPAYAEYRRVITHYEPYAPHIYLVDGKIGMIDWENVGWGHPLQDLSVLWIRIFDNPQWQEEYTRLIEELGYFKGHGRLFWESELIIQCFAKLTYIDMYGPLGTPEYDRRAIAFFCDTIDRILDTSPHFKA